MSADPSARPRRVLYIDDEPDIREVTQLALETLGGYDVCSCISGEEALAVAAGFAPDLVLLDVMMPGMDGPATLKALRAIASLERTPVVFFTAKAMRDEVDALRRLGAIGVIAKPFDPVALPEMIATLWAEAGGAIARPDPLEAKLAGLRATFIAERLPVLVEEIEACARRAAAAGWERELAFEARLAAHSLHGVAGTHELPAVSAAAAAIEALMGTAATRPDPALAARLESELAVLHAAAHAVRAPAPAGDAG